MTPMHSSQTHRCTLCCEVVCVVWCVVCCVALLPALTLVQPSPLPHLIANTFPAFPSLNPKKTNTTTRRHTTRCCLTSRHLSKQTNSCSCSWTRLHASVATRLHVRSTPTRQQQPQRPQAPQARRRTCFPVAGRHSIRCDKSFGTAVLSLQSPCSTSVCRGWRTGAMSFIPCPCSSK